LPGPGSERNPSHRVLRVSVLLAKGIPAAEVAEMTDVPSASVELIAVEQRTATLSPRPLQLPATSPADRLVNPSRSGRVRLLVGCDAALSIVAAGAAVTSVIDHRPVLSAIAVAGSLVVLAAACVSTRGARPKARKPPWSPRS